MIREQDYVITSFRKHFQRFQDKGIVVYGLGKNTEVLLDALRDEYHFIGLMDGVRTGETVYGLPVLTVDEAQERGVGVILILARAANLSIIYPRIAADCARYGIPVFVCVRFWSSVLMSRRKSQANMQSMKARSITYTTGIGIASWIC